MDSFAQQFEQIYKKFADWASQQGFKPNRTAFARHIGVSQGCMQKWEKGQRPTAQHIKLIHDKLGFAFTWLISGKGEMFDEAAKVLEEQKAEIARKDAEIARLTAENRRLTTQLFMEGDSTEESAASTGNAAGQG